MAFIHAEAAALKLYDVCVVGSGPAGLAAALGCARRGLSVIILEAGDREPGDAQSLADAQIENPAQHAPADITSCRAFGGSSQWWGRRCVPLQPDELAAQPNSPPWPMPHSELAGWRDAAADFLGCGRSFELEAPADWDRIDGLDLSSVERLAPEGNMAKRHAEELASETGPEILLNAPVAGFVIGEQDSDDAEFQAAECVVGSRRIRVWAKRFVLACGGLGTARLMLAEQRYRPSLFGGSKGVLGRGYVGHLTGAVADIKFANRRDVAHFEFHDAGGGTVERRQWRLNAPAAAGLPAIFFWVDNAPMHDPTHGCGALSFKYLMLSNPTIGRRLMPDALRHAIIGEGGEAWGRHLLNIATDPVRTAVELSRVAHARSKRGGQRPDMLARSRKSIYALRYQAEQVDNSSNRVSLTNTVDATGLPRVKVDFSFSDDDYQAVIDAHDRMARVLDKSGLAQLSYRRPPETLKDLVAEYARDGYHQIGATRMGDSPSTGVVDKNCRAFGSQNLYLATSGVFPSGAAGNPTFTIVALALRLAAHIGDGVQARAKTRPEAAAV